MALELFEVPEEAIALHRSMEIESNLARAKASEPDIHNPVVYLSFHGEELDIIEEIRIAAYAFPTSQKPFFTYVWEVVPELEDPDEVAERIIEQIAKPLGASVTVIEGVLPDERCPCCGEKSFRGPPPVETVD
jgi:hypothetical protein